MSVQSKTLTLFEESQQCVSPLVHCELGAVGIAIDSMGKASTKVKAYLMLQIILSMGSICNAVRCG